MSIYHKVSEGVRQTRPLQIVGLLKDAAVCRTCRAGEPAGEIAMFSDLPVKRLVRSFPNAQQLKQGRLELSGIILMGTALAHCSH